MSSPARIPKPRPGPPSGAEPSGAEPSGAEPSGAEPQPNLARLSLIRPTRAVEPPASPWVFPSGPPQPSGRKRRANQTEESEQGRLDEVVGTGADLEPGTLLSAYRAGLFPMPVRPGLMAWWSPDPRGIVPLDGLRVTRSLRRSCSRFTVQVDTAFDDVVAACADPGRRGGWIDADIRAAYGRLHRWGWAHSVEAWDEAGRLAGGLYGVAIGGFFAGESMFHRQADASKVALVGLVEQLRSAGASLLDVQWATPHLKSLGAVEVRRPEYLARLEDAIRQPHPAIFGGAAR